MSYASTDDVELELGHPASSDAELGQWQAWLDRVERKIERGFRRAGLNLPDQIALDDPLVVDVIDVEVSRVVDKINNPNPRHTSVTRNVDDAAVTYRNESGDNSDPLDLSEDEWAALLPAGGRRRSRAFSVMPS